MIRFGVANSPFHCGYFSVHVRLSLRYLQEAMNMADKIDVKLVLELQQANMSQRAIAASRHISTKSVAAVWKRADVLGISYADVADKSDDEVYLLFFPDKFQKETMYAPSTMSTFTAN